MAETYEIKSLGDMEIFAKNLVKRLNYPCILLLKGQLGAGKTTMTQYIAHELGVKNFVVSPTYLFMQEYRYLDDKHLLHLDLYRFHDAEKDLAAEREYLIEEIDKNKDITIIEWPIDRLVELFIKSKQILNVEIEVGVSDSRTIRLLIT